ncbi:hypothetical protein ZIOFF_035535 [Zingiber officinale]|uniref:VPS9 domain-containing protein n=1 Tax=Zingiber officinale TaxID=94328 RepID=A0A8J5GGL7_ZINOF|nr:hypothetical protein ZIOFF_035535 [Zingiber officinale]
MPTSILLAQKELQKINMYKAPRDKLVGILNCCKVINNLLINASIASNENPPGADEFLPVLIYVTIKANPPQLHSNLLYIQRYRRQSRLVSEAAYFFTNILSAESFIWNIDAQAVSMEEKEFLNKMESARAHLMGTSTSGEDQQTETNLDALEQRSGVLKANRELDNSVSVHGHHVPSQSYDANKDVNEKALTNMLSISDLEKKGAADLLEENTSKYFQDYPFLFANAGDLTIQDVHSLLNCYKKLVLKYVALSKGMGIHKESVPLSTESSSALQTVKEHEYLADLELKNGNAEVSKKNSYSTVDLILQMDEMESKKSIEGSNAETNE